MVDITPERHRRMLTETSDEYINRDRGILTKRDREFLLDSDVRDELDSNEVNQKRYNIRQRVRNSLLDFTALLSLREEDIELIFSEYDEFFVGSSVPHMNMAINNLFRFLRLGLEPRFFRGEVEGAIADMEWNRYYYSNNDGKIPLIEVNIEVDITPVEELKRRRDRGQELSEIEEKHLQLFTDSENNIRSSEDGDSLRNSGSEQT